MENAQSLEKQELLKNLINTLGKNRYFDLDTSFKCFDRYFVEKIYDEPQQRAGFSLETEYLAIGKTEEGYEVCVGVEGHNSCKVYLYGQMGFKEYFSKNEHGKDDEYQQEDIYGFKSIANDVDDFAKMLFC